MTQTNMFGPPPTKPPEGHDGVINDEKYFLRRMREIAEEISHRCGQVDCDDLREYAANKGIEPKNPNWWGLIFSAREIPGLLQVGRKPSRWPSNHSRQIFVWRFPPRRT
ncbi:hypothetical protein LCGC14_1600820 [marine sediment metagenome]|uniref:Uncharacterized protein n=1 Tax=marine sediment metagenome TaxID=412755 RepID=A0A0F9IBK2_9ZZZZ